MLGYTWITKKGNKPKSFKKIHFHFEVDFHYFKFNSYFSLCKSSNKWVFWVDLYVSTLWWFSSTIFTIFVLLLDFWDIFRKDINDHTNHHNNNNPSIANWPFKNQIFWVTPLTTATFAQSITHMNTLTIIHNNTKSTNGSSSRKAHNLVIQPLNEILKFHKNNPIIAIKITNVDFHNIDENKKNRTFSPLATITGNTNKQKAKITK